MRQTYIKLANAITEKRTRHGQNWHVVYHDALNMSKVYVYDVPCMMYYHETETISVTPTSRPSRTVLDTINNMLSWFNVEKRLIKRQSVIKFIAKDEALNTAEALDNEAWLTITPARPTHINVAQL